jgi:myo-inositol-1(or 4)-monophosphatase
LPGLGSDLDLIRQAALEAGELANDILKAGKVRTWAKSGGSPVTNADLEVDALLRRKLIEARPDYGWLSEETLDDEARLGVRRVFVVDPIDGTIAYFKGRPWWAVCIGVVEDGVPVAGVLYAPAVAETYEAVAGGGARLNGQTICASSRAQLEGSALLADARTLRRPDWPTPWPEDLRIETRNSVAYRMALVAAGAFDAVVALSSKCDWDLAAADLIVQEAGGLSTDHLGRRFVYNQPSPRKRSLVCAGPALHPLILERVGHIELPKPSA